MPLKQRIITQISCGDSHTLALEKTTGDLWAWGASNIKAG